MNNFLQAIGQTTRGFLRDQDGAQVVEYALMIAVVLITMIVALEALAAHDDGFGSFIARVTTCLTTADCV